jgi:hypothetical protein
MQAERIGLVYLEVIFSEMYQGMPSFTETFQFLLDHHFQLVSYYRPNFQNDLLSWTDVLFVQRKLSEQRPHRQAKGGRLGSR